MENDKNSEEEYETITIKIPTDTSNISKEKIEEYKNFKEWTQLDTLFNQLMDLETTKTKDILLEIIDYGEIVKVKYEDKMNNLKEEDILTQEFVLLPMYINMSPEQANEIIAKRFSDDEEEAESSAILLNELLQDNKIEELIEIVKNARKANDHEDANGAMGELFRYGEYALPKLRLTVVDPNTSQELMDDIATIIATIILGEKEGFNLINRCMDEDPNIWKPAQKEIRDLINRIDPIPYLLRHPKEVPKDNS